MDNLTSKEYDILIRLIQGISGAMHVHVGILMNKDDKMLEMIEGLSKSCAAMMERIEKLDSTGSAHTAKMSAAVKEVPTVLPQADTESQKPTTDESSPPPNPSPSEPASIPPELELSLQRIAEAASVRQGTPLPERYLSTHASISFAKPIVKPKSGA
jgi:hypothetical protein